MGHDSTVTASAFTWQKNDDTGSSTAVAVTGDFNGGLRVWDYKEAESIASGKDENEAEGATPLVSKRRRLGKKYSLFFFLIALTHFYVQPPNAVTWLVITYVFIIQGSQTVQLSPSLQYLNPISSFKAHTQVHYAPYSFVLLSGPLNRAMVASLSQKICGICSIPNGLVYTGSWDR